MKPVMFHLRKGAKGYVLYPLRMFKPTNDRAIVVRYPFQGYWASAQALALAGAKMWQFRDDLNCRLFDSIPLYPVCTDILELVAAQNRIPRRPNRERRQQAFAALMKVATDTSDDDDRPGPKAKRQPRVSASTRKRVKKVLNRAIGEAHSLFVETEAEIALDNIAYKARMKALQFRLRSER